MEDDRDILGKADALLRRHVPPRTGSRDAPEVPVLTELITPGAARTPSPAAGPSPAARDEDAIRKLVAEIVEAVQERLAQDLERRTVVQLNAEIQACVAAALKELRQEVSQAVQDAVAEALARREQR